MSHLCRILSLKSNITRKPGITGRDTFSILIISTLPKIQLNGAEKNKPCNAHNTITNTINNLCMCMCGLKNKRANIFFLE